MSDGYIQGPTLVAMKDQPLARETEWLRTIWAKDQRKRVAAGFIALRITSGIRADCTWCAEMIFASQTGCEVILGGPQGQRALHFHPNCYDRWTHS